MKVAAILMKVMLISSIQAQTTLLFEDFENAPSAFDLNTSDVSSTASGANKWILNDQYLGGNGDLFCIINFPFTVNSTAAQPAGISNQNGQYLHIISNEALNDGILCCSFQAADGLCTNGENNFSRMSSDISTVGFTDVTVDFWWLCSGGASIFGEVYYSIDGGVSWNLITIPFSQYNNQSNWGQQTIGLPVFDGQPNLRFGFRFVNNISISAADPGFGVDDISISGTSASLNEINTDGVSSLSLCPGDLLDIEYTASGIFNTPNIFIAELSDGNGSFALPTVIGTLSSTISGVISATIPGNAVSGSGYRVRVTSSDPMVTGSTNLNTITIESAPNAGADTTVTFCKASGFYDLFTFIPGSPDPGGNWTYPGGQSFSGALSTISDPAGIYTYSVSGIGNCSSAASEITVELITPPNSGSVGNGAVCEDGGQVQMINLLVSSPDLNGIWLDPNGLVINGIFDPILDPLGTYIYVVAGIEPCLDDSTYIDISIIPAADAGIGGTVNICNTSPTVDLFLELSGSPDGSGSWTDPQNMPFNGLLDPSTGSSGLYTYTVDGGVCPDASASLAVVIDDCTGVEEFDQIDISIAPNPVTDELIIRTRTAAIWKDIVIMDLAGKQYDTDHLEISTGKIIVGLGQSFSNGMYLLFLSNGERALATRFVVGR